MVRRRRKRSRSRTFHINIGKWGVAINALWQTGLLDAFIKIMGGDFSGAASVVRHKFSSTKQAINTLLAAGVPAILLKVLRWTVGPMPLISGKHIRISLW